MYVLQGMYMETLYYFSKTGNKIVELWKINNKFSVQVWDNHCLNTQLSKSFVSYLDAVHHYNGL